jgi:hypothetical protein
MDKAKRNAEYQQASRARRKAEVEHRKRKGEVKVEIWLDAEAVALLDRQEPAEGVTIQQKYKRMAQYHANKGIKELLSK